MFKYRVLILLCLGFTAGVGASSAYKIPYSIILFLLFLCVCFFAFYLRNGRRVIAAFTCVVMAFLLGVIRMNITYVPNEFYSLFDEKSVTLEGYVTEEPDIRLDKQFITFAPNGHSQKLLLTIPLSKKILYGDWVVVTGKVTQAKSSSEFDYAEYLERYHVYGLMYYPKCVVLKNNKLNPVTYGLLRFKNYFSERLGRVFKEPEKSLLLGILIGAKKTLPQNILDDFKITGTSHIIAVSGFNISIIINALFGFSYVFGRRISFWTSLFCIVCFVIIAGASASVLRAAIMGSMLLLSSYSYRQYRVGAVMCFTAACMLVQNPRILISDVGFQLSFLATLGIVYFLPLFEKLCKKVPSFFGVTSAFLGTCAAILATLPTLLLHFGTLSFIAPLVNVLVLPVVGLVMALGFISAFPIIGPGIAMLTSWILKYIFWVIHTCAQWSFASSDVPIPLWFFWVLMGALIGLYFVLLSFVKDSGGEVEETPEVW